MSPISGSVTVAAAPGPDMLGTCVRASTRGRSAELFFGKAGGEFGDDIELAEVARVLLEQVEQHPLQGRRAGAVPAFTRLAHVVEVVGGDDGPAAVSLVTQRGQQDGGRLGVGDVPAAVR